MAYFKWHGVDLNGATQSGKTFARTEKDLDSLLLEREIALLSCTSIRPFLINRSINLDTKVHFFKQLAVLLDAGIMLPEALQILASLITNKRLQGIVCTVVADVQEGIPFAQALKRYPNVFDSLTIRMVRIGHEAGKLSYALQQLGDYLETTQRFKKKLKSAATVPLITFGFFLFVAFAIFLLVIPRFADIFNSMNKELPKITQLIIKTSTLLRSSTIILMLLALVGLFFSFRWYKKTKQGAQLVDRFILKLPWTGQLVANSSIVYFLQSVSMLLQSGVPLVLAMQISKTAVHNAVILSQINFLEKEVTAGTSLSNAMQKVPGSIFAQDLVSLAKVGEESGLLGPMLKKGAAIYLDKVNRSLSFFTRMFQPLLMIILGLLITLLIFAIYLPVFSLSNIG